jgi:hypothetical protein
MRVVRAMFATGFAFLVACATGTSANDDTTGTDSGGNRDSSTSGKDSSSSNHDTGTSGQDVYTQPETGGNCGGTCLGVDNTCCNNQCVDTTSDQNNCGGCSMPCNSLTCCSSTCVDTMGSDDNNCGGCGTICNGTCNSGVCTSSGCTVDIASCAHSPCVTGVALSATCDISDEGIVEFICIEDASCCSSTWDSTCVGWAQLFESSACAGC